MRAIDQKTRGISPARKVALSVLAEVARGEYASDTLQIKAQTLAPRDAGLATQLVFGCLRYQKQLDFLIHYYSGRKAEALDEAVRLSLRLAIFQMRYLERIPPRAAVNEAVEYVKRECRSASGLVNAVLRKVTRAAVEWPSREVRLSCPEWLLARWSQHFGENASQAIAEAAMREPAAYVRVPAGSSPPDDSTLEETSVAGAYRVVSGDVGQQRLQDIGSQSVVPWLGIGPGDRYLDLCAAPGNKTVQAMEYRPRFAVACDVSPKRLRDVPPVCSRVVLDATERLPFPANFTRILIDAPCSGTGTLARNPEIKWRLTEADLARFAARQSAILRHGARVVERGGRILYATCSLEREENEDVVAGFLQEEHEFRLLEEHWRLPGRDEGDGFYGALLERG